MAPFSSSGYQRYGVPPRRFPGCVCQPSLDLVAGLVAQGARTPPPQVFTHLPLLGFSHMVAPLNAHGRAQNALHGGPSLRGNVCELLGGVYAEAKVAPSLYSIIR